MFSFPFNLLTTSANRRTMNNNAPLSRQPSHLEEIVVATNTNTNANENKNENEIENENDCWICMSCKSNEAPVKVCKCPSDKFVHKSCIAKWQLQSMGSMEEFKCRFCFATLPCWKESFATTASTPAPLKVTFKDEIITIVIHPNQDPVQQFENAMYDRFRIKLNKDNCKLEFTAKVDEMNLDKMGGVDDLHSFVHLSRYNVAKAAQLHSEKDAFGQPSHATLPGEPIYT